MSAGRLAGRINSEIVKRNRALPTEDRQALVDEATAQGYIDQFHGRYPGVRAFFDREWKKLKKLPQDDRVVQSPLGRIRRFNTFPSKALERSFKVTWPQQIEADLIKTAMLRLDRIFRKRNMEGRIIMMIHYALWVECPEREAEQIKHLMRRMMTAAGKLKVPLSVEME